MAEELWLLVKRGLFYRPNDCGYTGIRDHAGRYTADEARARAGSEIKMVRLTDAPEFSEACFDDLARAHLATQRDAAMNDAERLRRRVVALERLISEEIDAWETSDEVNQMLIETAHDAVKRHAALSSGAQES